MEDQSSAACCCSAGGGIPSLVRAECITSAYFSLDRKEDGEELNQCMAVNDNA
eukprot:CAMPEP_0170991776 /NCGR_PEP_ID=MMETSP0736-20130129/9316_1 /TAXON_ID=186038 /ORGANISM="Fragilariopsis kerguelensis, Strain L26-C5" /LENGTH=52 /DNA_ID=CAMNT_0011417041 /DNA_START=385 /DNA_END=539 /DNA_ORIENTATION=-